MKDLCLASNRGWVVFVEREGEVGGKVLRGSSNDAKGSKGGNAEEGESRE